MGQPSISSSDRASASKGRRPVQAVARAAASALPAACAAMFEPLEKRRMFAVTYSSTIVDPGGGNSDFYSDIQRMVNFAGNDWGKHFNANASIQVQIEFEDAPGSSRIARAGSTTLEPIRKSGTIQIVEPGVANEIRTGQDPNGGIPDAIIVFNTAFLDKMFFDPDPTQRIAPIPNDKIDAYSVVLHELGHANGIIATKDDFTGAIKDDQETTYDEFVQFTGPTTVIFTGSKAAEIYGQPPPLRLGSVSHYGNRGGPGADLDNLLMSADISPGERASITDIDLAILFDIGLPITFTGGTTPPPPVPPTLDVGGTNKSDIIDIVYTGSKFLVNVTNKTKVSEFNFFTGQFELVDQLNTARYQFDSAGFTQIIIHGKGGDDKITVNADMISCSIDGGDGNDTIYGGNGDDTISGGAGKDRLYGNAGADRLIGDAGIDQLFGGTGRDRVFGGSNSDYVDGGADGDTLMGSDGDDTVVGGDGDDSLYGEAGNDELYGTGGNDRMIGGDGGDHIEGGTGTDVADYSDRSDALIVTLDETSNDGGSGEGDNVTFTTENVFGGTAGDRLVGNGQNNLLAGGKGNDSIDGGSGDDFIDGSDGNDVIDGQIGNDTLDGAAGNDRIQAGIGKDLVFGGSGNDRIFTTDFNIDTVNGGSGNDTVDSDGTDIIEDAGL